MFENEEKVLAQLGRRLKQTRLERDDSQRNFSFRIGISGPTLQKMEKGSPQVAMGTWVKAMNILGKLNEFDALLAPKKSLADRFASYQKTGTRQRASKRKS